MNLISLEEYDPLWLEVRRFLSIRSAKSPHSFKHRDLTLFLSDVTGVDQLWVWSSGYAEPLFPFNERIGGASIGCRDSVAFLWDIGGNERWVLDVYSIERGSIERVHGDGKRVVTQLGVWDSECGRLYFTSTSRNGVDFDLYEYSRGLGVRLVVELEGTNTAHAWIGEGRVLLVHMNTNLDSDIYLVDVFSGKLVNLTKHDGEAQNFKPLVLDSERFLFLSNYDREYVGIALYDLGAMKWKYVYRSKYDVEDMDLSPRADGVVFIENQDGYSKVYTASNDFSKVELIDEPEGVVGRVSWGATGIFYDVSGPRVGHEVFAVLEKSARKVTNSPKFGARVEECILPESVYYESWDGLKIPALVYKPKTGKPPYPAVVVVHGGPEGQARPSFDPLTQLLARLGYLVLAPNF
ncbi:MAG: hypothetical protein NZ925_05515, partial [Sulfolobales archaeon]|nr:hypothetical protein [Sulfolobales archaeon]